MDAHLFKPLDLYALPLAGVQLVEASAGTGKTWTIAGLYVRLLLETAATVDRVLVVTFTRAATAELRERLRARLHEVERALAAGASDDPFCQWALARFTGAERVAAREKLAQSLRGFDEAAIHTIHGFCQRVLGDAQVPALLTEPDIVPDERDWLPGLVQEAWIRHCRSPLLADLLAAGRLTPDTVRRDVEVLLLKPFLHLESGAPAIDVEQLQWRQQALAHHWQQARDAIRHDIETADALSRARDQYKDADALLAALEAWLHGTAVAGAEVRKLTPACFEEKRKQKGRLPQHPFWQELAAWFDAADGLLRQFRRDLIDDVRVALAAHKRQQGLLSYQDLLALLADALVDDRVAAGIRTRFDAALIDEFQDTDPLQFRIFDRLFAHDGTPLYLVGDPKQAIYSFRGADIFTYLRARQSAAGRYTLGTNRRSVPALVGAVNALFTRHSNPFLFSDLRFPPADSVAATALLLPEAAPFHCSLLPADGDKPLSKEAARALSVQETVAEITGLLRGAQDGVVVIGERPLRPGDIAVLVPRHRDGRAVTEALAQAGVPAVIRSQESVFATAEAADMLALLEAVAEPGREGSVKAACLSGLMGVPVEELFAWQEDDVAWSALIEKLLAARERWHGHGFMPLWEGLLAEFSVYERVLGGEAGERRLTNLRHLATLMQQQADAVPEPERQLAWLRDQVQESAADETTQLRLESDAERVQVLTIHVSKGLEYPVVFCPFLWDGALLHATDDGRAEYRAGAESLLDIGSENFAQARTRMATERMAERLRVLYVALTRAKYRCHVIWGCVRDSELAPFSWLLLGGNTEGDPDADVLARDLRRAGHDEHVAALQALAAALPQAFAWSCIDADAPAPAAMPPAAAALEARLPAFTRRLERRWRVSSFTGLSEGAHEPESPDYDVQSAVILPVEEVVPQGIHAFPRGARAGVFWHALLEDCVGTGLDAVARAARTVARMQEHAIAPEWQAQVAATLEQVLATPLDTEGACLGRLDAARAEMEFLYPVQRLDRRDFLALPALPAVYREAVQALEFPVLQGYLKGFIDLVYRHDGRYYVLDYKTNWLGLDDHAYTPERLQAAMASSHYYLQYWLYVLALHRHLRAVQPGYDYERDMGGVRYLFLRGIGAPTRGVYAARPPRVLVEALDRLLHGGGA
jgi:exodeoxyribonuclease V beta subunit